MADFKTEIRALESDHADTYDIKKGRLPIIFTSAHGIEQKKRSGRIKFAEPYTRSIAKYVGRKTNSSYLIKNEDTGTDPNRPNHDEFKALLINLIENNHIKILIDLHGAKRERDFDIEIGTLNGRSADQKLVQKLVDCMNKHHVKNIAMNEPFKGGDITRTVYNKLGINCIQLEINYNYRNLRKIKNLRNICKALIDFTK